MLSTIVVFCFLCAVVLGSVMASILPELLQVDAGKLVGSYPSSVFYMDGQVGDTAWAELKFTLPNELELDPIPEFDLPEDATTEEYDIIPLEVFSRDLTADEVRAQRTYWRTRTSPPVYLPEVDFDMSLVQDMGL